MLQTINQILSKEKKLAIGLMSGTSLDGIDVAVLEISHSNSEMDIQLIAFETIPYTQQEKQDILQLCQPSTSTVDKICAWNVKLGHKFAKAATKVVTNAGMDISQIDFVGSHGQTIYHSPDEQATLQIGELAVIAEETGVLTVGDFRPSDMAVGGQGAPLVPFVDYLLFASEEKNRVLLNIGGISNISVLPKKAQPDEIIAFDTGPGNVLLDAIVRIVTEGEKRYDEGGSLASGGRVSQDWLTKMMREDSYLDQDIPKSTGREYYTTQKAQSLYEEGRTQGLSDPDIIATISAYTAHSIADQLYRFVEPVCQIDEIIVSGGGAHNGFILRELEKTTKIQVQIMEDLGFSSDAKEAVAFAVLGYQFLHGLPNTLPSATGARRQVSMGKLAFPLKKSSF